MKNWRQTILSQYWDSPVITALLDSINDWISPDADLEAFYNMIWDIEKEGGASGYGLDVWGRIVNIGRIVSLTDQGGPFFGFGEAGDRVGFGQGPFFNINNVITTNFTLTDEIYRLLIFAKAAYNITDGSIPAINAILMNLFPNRGNAYVKDGNNGLFPGPWFGFGEAGDRVGFGQGPFGDYVSAVGDMTLTYVFNFVLEPFEIAIVTQRPGVLPKPVGVAASVSYLMS